ncbi:hypothetical protein SLEP1_g52218 [Rubroshorea leprosula]|uniref:HTH La-type RNA-binding domain-containing protein n=1 Tax=Rubroshorea leprosula TaxID=152421 RepID=A0AAV5M5K1_9ROSI|nr:hypothetical protein SLEP1_g52218 [Rubroshorea leprosula]
MAANNNNANSNSSTGTVVSNHTKPIASPWTKIDREGPELIAVAPTSPSSSPSTPSTAVIEQAASASPVEEESVENGSGTNDNAGKKPAWGRPSNGAAEVGSVMGTQWPALSESARVSSKSSPDSSKVLSDGSSLSSPVVSQGTGNASVSSQKHVSNNANSNSTPNHTAPARQRSMKRNNSGVSQPPPAGSAVEASLNSPSSRDHARGGFISQSHSGNDHPQHRNSFRIRNGGPHPRGDGSHTQNYGGRRNQDHGNQDWNHHRNFNGRDAPMQSSQRGVPRFPRHGPPPPPNPAPYMPPPPSRPFGNPMAYPEFQSVYYVPAPTHPDPLSVPFITPIPPVFFPPPDLQLHDRIVNQIDYYFSNENLIKDTFLRQKMDAHGWVDIKLIAGFKKVSGLTDKIPIILDAMRSSKVVEVQGDKIRKRDDWKKWIMPQSVQIPNVPSPRFGENSSQDVLAAGIQNISLDQNVNNWSGSRNHAESSSGDLNDQLLSSSEGMAVSAQGGPVRISS